MSVERTKLNDAEEKLSFDLSSEEIENYFNEILKQESKKITIQGFRKGKAPLDLVRKMYGKAIFYENLDKIAQNRFWDEIDLLGINVLGTPKLTVLDLKKDGGLKFDIQFEVIPDLQFDSLDSIEVEKKEFELSDEYVNHLLESVQFQLRKEEDAEEITSKDFLVTIEAKPVNEENQEPNVYHLALTFDYYNPDFVNLLMNKKIKDEFETDIPLLKQSENEQNPQNQTIKYKIAELKKIQLPVLDDELAKMYSDGKFNTLEELKKHLIDKEIEEIKKSDYTNFKKNLKNRILDAYSFTPPLSIVDSFKKDFEEYLRKKVPNANLNEEGNKELIKSEALKEAKWYVIQSNLISKFNLQLTDEEIDSYASELAQKYNANKVSVIAYLKSERSSLLAELQLDKIYKFLEEKVKIKTEKVVL